MGRPSASRRKLLAECQAFVHLPWWQDDRGPASVDGTEAHQRMENIHLSSSLSKAHMFVEQPHTLLSHVPTHLDGDRPGRLVQQLLAGVASSGLAESVARAEKHPQGRVFAEAAFAFTPSTRSWRFLCEGKGRDEAYALCRPDELFTGTVDLIVVVPGEPTMVVDYKTTWDLGGVVDAEDQIRTGCQAVSDVFGGTTFRGVQLSATEDEHASVQWMWDALELAGHDAELAEDILSAPEAAPAPGEHCKYCPARGDCPSKTTPTMALVRHAKPELVENQPFSLSTVLDSPEHAAWQLAAVDAAESILDVLKGAVKRYVDEHGDLPIGDGYVYRKYTETREDMNLENMKAAELVVREAPRAVKMRASWADLEKAVGKERAESIREDLRALGAVKFTTFDKYARRKVK